jgi:hypothetical protein
MIYKAFVGRTVGSYKIDGSGIFCIISFSCLAVFFCIKFKFIYRAAPANYRVSLSIQTFRQCFGSGSGLDPDSIRSLDLDPYPGGQKRPTKVEK